MSRGPIEAHRPRHLRRRRPAQPRRARLVVPLSKDCSVAVKPGVKLQTFVSWLQDLLSRFSRLESQDLQVAEAVEALAGKE